MAGITSLNQGIQAIQQGNHKEGARLLRIALRDSQLDGALRATACVWLAETRTEREEKLQCYQDALTADPTNELAKQRMAALLNSDLPPIPQPPPTQTQTQPQVQPSVTYPQQNYPQQPQQIPPYPQPAINYPPQQPQYPQQPQDIRGTQPVPVMPGIDPLFAPQMPLRSYRTVGIFDGPSGTGTGFFIRMEGLVVTSRLVTGGMENLTVELERGRSVMGKVVRSYPEFDLALIRIDMTVNAIAPFSTLNIVPENTDLTAVAHGGAVLRGRCRPTKRKMSAQWFPTTFRQLADLGGCPIFDDRNAIVGMITRNTSRASPDVYGLHINVIRSLADQYIQEMRMDPNRVYCPSCGYLSRAASFGAFYCETCGSILPFARAATRFPVPYADPLYNENMSRPCRHCTTRVGYYDGRCLRCGRPEQP